MVGLCLALVFSATAIWSNVNSVIGALSSEDIVALNSCHLTGDEVEDKSVCSFILTLASVSSARQVALSRHALLTAWSPYSVFTRRLSPRLVPATRISTLEIELGGSF